MAIALEQKGSGTKAVMVAELDDQSKDRFALDDQSYGL